MVQVFIALLLFTFFAFGGLVSDLGLVRLTQRQMNTSSDAAALEGMRLSDAVSETDRRAAARDALRAHFDDDFDVTASDAYRLGAGPVVVLSGGVGSMAANQKVDVAPSVVYEPQPALNLANAAHGDMVGGWFDEADLAHLESSTYARSDFDTGAGGVRPREAFLVRLRRTTGTNALDQQPGVSTRGPTLPYLFSRGSLMAAGMRARGVTVRSTSIAAGRPATLAGIPRPALGLVGTAPFAMEFDHWNTLAANSAFDLTFGEPADSSTDPVRGPPTRLDPSQRTRGAPPIIPPGQMVQGSGEPIAVFADRDDEARRAWSVGDPVWVDTNPDVPAALARLGDVFAADYEPRLFLMPIYEGNSLIFYDGRPGNSNPPFLPPVNNVPKDEMDPRIVGFGLVYVLGAYAENDADAAQGQITLFLFKLPSLVLPTNVSAVSTPGLAGLPSWLARQLGDLNKTVDGGVRAAALAR